MAFRELAWSAQFAALSTTTMERAIEVEWDETDVAQRLADNQKIELLEEVPECELPNIVFIPEKLHSEWKKTGYSTTGSEVEDDISDWLSDTFGFTHLGWSRMGDEWLPRKGDVIGDADFQIVY